MTRADLIPAGAVVSDESNNRFKIRHRDVHVPVRNGGEFARPAIGKVWWRNESGATWIVDVGSEWKVLSWQ